MAHAGNEARRTSVASSLEGFLQANREKAERLGYGQPVREDCDQPGLWLWRIDKDGCAMSLPSEREAWDDFWANVQGEIEEG